MKAWLLKGARPLPVVKNYPDPRLGYGTLCSGIKPPSDIAPTDCKDAQMNGSCVV